MSSTVQDLLGTAPSHASIDKVLKYMESSGLQDIIIQEVVKDVGFKEVKALSEPADDLAKAIAMSIFVQSNVFGFVQELSSAFGNIGIIEKYGNYAKLRVEMGDNTIGSLFGHVEDLKGQFEISEYSVSQTTLEQIFQSFASLNFDENVKRYNVDNGNLNEIPIAPAAEPTK